MTKAITVVVESNVENQQHLVTVSCAEYENIGEFNNDPDVSRFVAACVSEILAR